MRLIYMAHPYGGDAANLERARRWLVWLLENYGNRAAFVANWILECEELNDGDALVREQALRRDEVLAGHCDAIVLVGGAVSAGMKREADQLWHRGRPVYDLTSLGAEPPGEKWSATEGAAWRHMSIDAGRALRGLGA